MCGASNLSPSSNFPIAYIEIRVFSHATEDLNKVQTAVRNTLPSNLANELKFTQTNIMGHHGNPIISLETKLTDKAAMPIVLEKLAISLSPLDKEQLCTEIDQHIERHNLYLRLDKQNAYLGALKLTPKDPIHFKIHFKNRASDEIKHICRQAGLFK
jgi:RNA binding exosome subunit